MAKLIRLVALVTLCGVAGAQPPCRTHVQATGELTFDYFGKLTGRDCTVREILGRGNDETSAHRIGIKVTRRTRLVIDLTSADFDAYLYLTDAQGNVIEEDDDGGIAPNARIIRTLDPGQYYVLANTLRRGESGEYHLRVRPRQPCELSAATVELKPNQIVEGALGETSCMLKEIAPALARSNPHPNRFDNSYVKPYRLRLDRTGVIRIDLRSSQFDSFLWLLDENYKRIAANDDGRGRDAVIVQELRPGTYYVLVNSAGTRPSTGEFTLQTSLCCACEN